MAWFDSDYGYKKKITLDHTMIAGDETDFPVLISVTDNDLRDDLNGGHVESANGYDIIFTNGDEDTQLKHEIQEYTDSSGKLISWVKVPSISSSTDTEIYVYYGKSSVTINPSTTDTWDDNFVIVSHMHTDSIPDSTANGYDGINDGTDDIAGKIGQCRDFVAANTDSINFQDEDARANLDFCEPVTIEYWTKCDNWNSGTDLRPQYWNHHYNLFKSSDDKVRMYIYDETVTNTECDCSGYIDANWYYLAGTYDNTADFAKVYINGTKEAETSPGAGVCDCRSSDNLFLGKHVNDKDYFDGAIDEFRLSKIARSSNWLSTTYESTNDPSSFHTFGSEETESGGETHTPSDTASASDVIIFDVEIPLADDANASDTTKFDATKLLSDNAKASDEVSFNGAPSTQHTAHASDNVSFQMFHAHLVEDTAKASDLFSEIHTDAGVCESSCPTFSIIGDSYSVFFAKPIWGGESYALDKDLQSFNFWSGNFSVHDKGINNEPIILSGIEIGDESCGCDHDCFIAKFVNIRAMARNNEEIIISGLGDCIDATYVIKSFTTKTMHKRDARIWVLTLEYVRDT